MDVSRLTLVGRDLHARLRTFLDAPPERDAPPIEIAQAVLDAVEARVTATGAGHRVFPWDRVDVRVLATEDAHAAVEAVFAGLGGRVAERLREVRCEVPGDVEVHLQCLTDPPAGWSARQAFDVAFARTGQPRSAQGDQSREAGTWQLRLVVVAGAATAPTFPLRDATISMGRLADPTDGSGRPRRNRVAFLDVVDGITETVGRAHARLRLDEAAGHYRLYDEGSRNGTSIVRSGDVIVVPPRDPRGVRVQPGDEIVLGRAVLRVEGVGRTEEGGRR